MTHTPGPWTVKEAPIDVAHKRFTVIAADGRSPGADWREGGGLDDARLIAAAPDTLQMLKNMVEGIVAAREAAHWSAEQKQAWLNGLVDAARAAIAKAEGN